MTIKPEHREELKAFATGDVDRAQELNNGASEQDRIGYHKLLGAMFAILLDNHLDGDTSRAAIADFVDRIRRDYEAVNQPFNSLGVEGVIRATAGEEHLFDSLTNEDIMAAHMIVVGRLAIYDPEVSGNIDQFLDEAEELVAEWEREETSS